MAMREIRIRMYRVGFGDCFLLSLPPAGHDKTPHHVLIDCGVHPSGKLTSDHIQKVVDDIEKETGGKLAIVIASHAHADHVSGFAQCLESFNRFDINEIWLSWADDPSNIHAKKLQRGEWDVVKILDKHFENQAPEALKGVAGARRQAAVGAVANLKQTKPAMDALRGGFAGQVKPRYLKAKDTLSAPAGIDGLEVEVLGPSTDDAFLKRMDPPKSDEYLRVTEALDAEQANAIQPFGNWWRHDPGVVEKDPLFDELRLDDRDEIKEALTEQSFDAMAMKLDDVRNNASLVLLLKFRGKKLLFPGDAQYGNWRWWLDNLDGETILPEVDVLKVSHHGSLNASPKSAVEHLREGLHVMVSTQNSPFPTIPLGALIVRLKKLTTSFVRTDSIPIAEAPDAPKGPAVADLPAGFKQGDFWYDLHIPVQ